MRTIFRRQWRAAALAILVPALAGHNQPAQAASTMNGGDSLSCGPSLLGAPCGTAGPATLATGNGPGLGAGNPVSVATGNKYQRETDVPPLAGSPWLEVVRHYNSGDLRSGPLGTGWTLSYDTRLYRVGGRIQIVQADGSRIDFASEGPAATECAPVDPAHGVVTIQRVGAANRSSPGYQREFYSWRWPDGRVVEFDDAGRLTAIVAPTGERLGVWRGRVPGRVDYREIVRVTDGGGRFLRMHYGDSGIERIETPLGDVRYVRTSLRQLRGVVDLEGNARAYLYEPGHQAEGRFRLTGVLALNANGDWRRLNTWVYDRLGRVTRMTQGGPESVEGRVDIEYVRAPTPQAGGRDGLTVVRSASGGETRFHISLRGGRHVVSRVDGDPCAGCALPRESIRHDARGRVLSWGDTSVEYDALGRPTRIGSLGRHIDVSWRGSTRLPLRVDRPSVVPGLRHVVEIDWRAARAPSREFEGRLLPVALRETGWRPARHNEVPDDGAQPIARRIELAWHEAADGVRLYGLTASAPLNPTIPHVDDGRWPGLGVWRDDFGNVVAWRSGSTGHEARDFDEAGRLKARRFANDVVWRYQYDGENRPVVIDLSAPGVPGQRIELGWNNGLLTSVRNAFESEARFYNANGHLIARRVVRPEVAVGKDGFAYFERFLRDPAGRVVRHELPEGGALFYRWGVFGRLKEILWQDPAGRVRPLLGALADGYRHGNGVRARGATQNGRLKAMSYEYGDGVLWAQMFEYDPEGRIARETSRQADEPVRVASYAYDAKSRLAGVARHAADAKAPSTDWYAWSASGASLGVRGSDGDERVPDVERDPGGLPLRVGERRMTYGVDRRLAAVREHDRWLAHYRHNAYGERISREQAEGSVQYLYAQNKMVAEWRNTPTGAGVVRRYVYAHHVPIAMIEYATPQPLLHGAHRRLPAARPASLLASPPARVYAVHADAVGAPLMLTDDAGRVRWRTRLSPLGRAERIIGDVDFPLRLPGQVHDPATGWHDNYLRTYDAAFGHYLEPDPLGPSFLLATGGEPFAALPITSPFAYAAHQPRRYADPSGLVLFAFDGTRQDASTGGNVYEMALMYRDPVSAKAGLPDAYYRPGPGRARVPDADAVLATSADAILATQWRNLLEHLSAFQSSATSVNIDLLGYSRGAALARHFANDLANDVNAGRFWHWSAESGAVTACVDLRFMGLFDTVAQFGLFGTRDHAYNFQIAPDWQRVAHAVALHEHRRLFSLVSVAGADGVWPANTVEAGFVGAHADIGGGLLSEGAGVARLSDVVRDWMLNQAEQLGALFERGDIDGGKGSVAALHDMRSALERAAERLNRGEGAVNWLPSDRSVRAADNGLLLAYQADHADYGRQARAEAETFIERVRNWLETSDEVVGSVDMDGYAAWLAQRAHAAGMH